MVGRFVIAVLIGGVSSVGAPADLTTQWWANQPLQQPLTPTVQDTAWCTNDIDHFVLAKLEAAGLSPAASVDRATLIRRATYDLTGLPPTPQQVQAFVSDDTPQAWDQLIDRLLASEQYGVKWGRHWLDLVRYAETDGYERDRVKPGAWRYRDWVINAYNEDMPYDTFVLHQLAGDEVADRDFNSIVATGFLHLGVRDDEPTDPPRAIYDDLDGMLDVTCRATLGISMGCARCHDHKKDPISQRDYYSMLAAFRGMKPYRSGFGNTIRRDNFVRQLPIDFGSEDGTALGQWIEDRASAKRDIEHLVQQATSNEIGDLVSTLGWPEAGQVVHLDFEGNAELCEAGLRGHALLVNGVEQAIEINRPVADDFSITIAFRPDADGPGADTEPKWFLGAGLVDGEIPGVVDDFGLSWCKGGYVAAGFGNPETFLHSKGGHELGRWHMATLTRDRSSGDVALWVDGERMATATAGTQPLNAANTLHIGAMHTGVNAFPGALDEVRIHNRVLRANEILALHESPAFGDAAADVVATHFGMAGSMAHGTLVSRRLSLRRPVVEVVPLLAAIPVDGAPPDTFVLGRGNPDDQMELVTLHAPTMLGGAALELQPPSHGESSGRRLALAKWIVDRKNTRTARVLANRLWQHHFGRGIAVTPDEFGHLGLAPTHPALLDWLAMQAIDRKWSRKSMHKLIMQSSAYRMDSTGPLNQQDPMNELLHRFRPRRLTAEEVRDSMLAVCGSLNTTLGGPSVYPPLPEAVLATASRPDAAWGTSTPEQAARRSVYVHVKRSLRHPLLYALDQADTDTACPVRFTTMPPTQALILLNSKETNGYAGKFRDRLASIDPNIRVQCAHGLALVTQRPAESSNVDELVALYGELMDRGLGDKAAMKYVCLTMLNLNAFVHVD